MCQCRLDKRRCGFGLIVEKVFKGREALRKRVRRRHEPRVAGPGTANLHLRATHFARRLAAASRMGQQHLAHFAQQAHAQRQPAFQALNASLQRRYAAAHLAGVV